MAFLLCLKSENSGCALHQPAPLALHRPREHISASRPPRAKPQCPSLPACCSAMPVRYVPLYNAPDHRLICTFCQPSSQSIRHSLQAYSSAVPANQAHICSSASRIRNTYAPIRGIYAPILQTSSVAFFQAPVPP